MPPNKIEILLRTFVVIPCKSLPHAHRHTAHTDTRTATQRFIAPIHNVLVMVSPALTFAGVLLLACSSSVVHGRRMLPCRVGCRGCAAFHQLSSIGQSRMLGPPCVRSAVESAGAKPLLHNVSWVPEVLRREILLLRRLGCLRGGAALDLCASCVLRQRSRLF